MNPIDGSKLPAGSTLYLWGSVMPSTLEKGDPSAVRWIIDGKEVAKGTLEVYVIAPPAGKHSCRLQVEDRGKAIEKSVSFKTISLPKTSKEIEE
jgi:hypothetical protein